MSSIPDQFHRSGSSTKNDALFYGAVWWIHDDQTGCAGQAARMTEETRQPAIAKLKMESGRDCVGEKLAPFNPSGDEVD